MIVLAEDIGKLADGCELFPVSGTQIYGYFSRYGNGYSFCTTWLCQDEDGTVWGALGRYNQSLRLSCGELSPEQTEELSGFLGMTGCSTLELPLSAAEILCPDGQIKSGAVMEYRGKMPLVFTEQINTAPRLDDVYHILKESDPEFAAIARFDEWLCDAAHCRNHGGGWYAAIGREAVAGVTALSPKYGLIGSVATVPQARGKGYASLLTGWCVCQILGSGRIPILMAADARAQSVYQKIGFAETDRWAVISI